MTSVHVGITRSPRVLTADFLLFIFLFQSERIWHLVRFGSFASILARLPHVRLRGNLGSSGCPILPAEGIGLAVIQATKREPRIMRYELTDFEWAAIKSFLPNKPRGIPPDLPDDGQIAHGRHAKFARRAIVPQARGIARNPKSAPSFVHPASPRGAYRDRHGR